MGAFATAKRWGTYAFYPELIPARPAKPKWNDRYAIWPKIETVEHATQVARRSVRIELAYGALTLLLLLANEYGYFHTDFDWWSLTDVALEVLLAWGIRRMSKTAALLLVAYFVVDQILKWCTWAPTIHMTLNGVEPLISGIWWNLPALYSVVMAVIGTFAYARFRQREADLTEHLEEAFC
jgi:hypothetical protein